MPSIPPPLAVRPVLPQPGAPRFARLAERLGAPPGAAAAVAVWYERLMALYAAPHRRYHSTRHLAECLAAFDSLRQHAGAPDLCEWALWFHDAHHRAGATDCEARSAALLASMAKDVGIDDELTDHARTLVMATRHESPPSGADAEVVTDADLAILGAAPGRFERYERDVRQEYAAVPEDRWRLGRADVLRRLLARDPLYATPTARAAWEGRARANVSASLARLTRGDR